MSNSDIISLANTTISVANTMLVWAGVLIALVAIFATMYYNREKKKLIKQTADEFLDKIANNEALRNEFIQKILSNKDFKDNFEKMVDLHIQDKFDLLDEYKNEEKTIKEELQ